MFNFNKNKINAISLTTIIALMAFSFCSFINKPKMQLVVLYKNSPEIDTKVLSKLDVNYHGYNVGHVSKIKISKDRKHIEIFININSDDLILPSNTTMTFKTKNIDGKMYLDIETPKKPSKQFLSDGDFVIGTLALEKTSENLFKEITQEKPHKFVKNLREMTEELRISFENRDNEKILNQSADDLTAILNNLKEIVADPVFKKDMKPTIQHSCAYLKNVNNKVIIASNKQTSPINENLSNLNKTILDAHKELSKTSIFLTPSNDAKSLNDTKIQDIHTLADNQQEPLIKTNCSNTRSDSCSNKKTTFLKLVFGNQEKAFNKSEKKELDCTNITANK